MGAMNAWGHLVVVGAGGDFEELWDFVNELSDRAGHDGIAVHTFTPQQRAEGRPRFCVHPTGKDGDEVRGDVLSEVVLAAGAWLAKNALAEDDLWRRD